MIDDYAIPAFLDRTKLVYSYTNLNCYENVCPHQFRHRYILKTTRFVETEAMKHGTRVHEAMEDRIARKKPLPPDFLHWEPYARPFDAFYDSGKQALCAELKLGITAAGSRCGFFDNDVVWLRGKLDLVVVNGETAYIVDWKTGNSKYEDRFELDVGALMLHAASPKLRKIVGSYIWLKEKRVGQLYDLSETRRVWTRVTDIARRIEKDRQSGEFEKRPGPLCWHCDVKTCEHNRKKA
jgi:hypothetical protein